MLYKYAEDKWTMKEVLGHLVDSERIFGYRALCIARNEKQNLPCFDENEYVKQAKFNSRNIASIGHYGKSLLEEFQNLRNANILLFNTFDENILKKKGIACDKEISVNALIYIIAGHTEHHLEILKSKYLESFYQKK
ncbi:MAG: hypothetical protein STSR0008_21670 [Ignavibacterium sp.]